MSPTTVQYKYILDDGGRPVPCEDPIAWARWFTAADRTIARDDVGPVSVSTVFLGVNATLSDPPAL